MTFSHIPPAKLLPGAVNQMLADITYSGKVHEGDRYGLMVACCDDCLEEEERLVINRLLRSIVRGKFQIC
ncbi:hypothetical protein [[Limnothrix rosea] IAM M-220]|uniref:hypothetical protein n=1 Tax=[Limnothrix rosea] IAM M-220 TaxID=454133 RepID=UPI000A007514|nr:hypothetical protein [[Limnothrix rosea] IAM M-220]